MDIKEKNYGTDTGTALTKHLSPVTVWALAFGCAVGWGAFVMPGTTFLPTAGPIGSLLGMAIGAVIMFIIGANYHYLMNKFGGFGGAYTFAGKVLGSDNGFLCAWFLILTYIAVLWANATALSLIMRYLFGDLFCFGFSYTIAGYTVYFGEALLSVAVIALACFICMIGNKAASIAQTLFAICLIVGVVVCFIGVLSAGKIQNAVDPAFASNGSGLSQVFAIVILAPWAFIGFESVSHSTAEFKFPVKKALPIMGFALFTGALAYVLLTLCAASAAPEGFTGWRDYIANLGNLNGIEGLPTFYAIKSAMGTPGLAALGIAAVGGIATGLIANFFALSRLLFSMSKDEMLPGWFGKLGKRKTPVNALLLIALVSFVIPFLGRTAISWIVDVTTIGATIVYACVSISAFIAGKRDRKPKYMILGAIGFIISLIFILFFTLPGLQTDNKLATESFIILVVWSIVGIAVFRLLMKRDKSRKIGKSEIAWLVLFFLILLVSTIWLQDVTADKAASMRQDIRAYYSESENTDEQSIDLYVEERTDEFRGEITSRIYVHVLLVAVSFIIIYSIFLVIRKSQQQAEIERARAEDVSRAKSVFLSNMSHDIRTPMNAITGYTTLALKKESLPVDTKEYLEKIDYSSKHLLSLINDILDMSRIESGKMEIEPTPGDLVGMMDEIYDIFILQMQAKKLTYTVDSSGVTDRFVVFDKNRLHRVLMNLISNALKFTPENGSITVTLTETGKSNEGVDFELRVKDTGIGMSKEFAEHVFEAFERERDKTVNQIQGTGLGMSITKSFVDLMHGDIHVETEKGKGSEFIINITFPEATEEEIAELMKEENNAADSVDFSGMKLLLVEDNPINKEIAFAILEGVGFTVEYAENGKVALDLVESSEPGRFDAILMDVQMPVMNGYDATRAIRSLGGERSVVPIIAMSANAFEEDVKEALAAGMDAHIAKPIDINAMMETLTKILKK